ncbi:beta strand repeat-containing protein [Brucella sp. 2716]|uniref:beta strand repeat-containing protein n=1 Tax=Brucella sp. 2716 TaxID=2975052 RepID=UPI00217E2AB0|nr:autotransporter-associated beta strand repeat-containing protein [Brucella sp. 2716]UWF60422.1 autotransporter-associated beta strand repeat-containing protein [Brucella sp. 2716]
MAEAQEGAGGAGSPPLTATNGTGGNGGTGGIHGHIVDVSGASYTNETELEGSDGAPGEDGTPSNAGNRPTGGGGGGGGAGGFGLVVNQAATITNALSGTILGGTGGIGGTGGNATRRAGGGDGGDGGDGGVGIWLNSDHISVTNLGLVRGGAGQKRCMGGQSPDVLNGPIVYQDQGGDPGAGGAGIYGPASIDTSVSNAATGKIYGGDGGESISQSQSLLTSFNADGGNGGDGIAGVLSIYNRGIIQGGNGTDAGAGSHFIGDPNNPPFKGANGGAGGNGVVLTNGMGLITNSGTVTGGQGAAGGTVLATSSASSGNGGNGGSGIIAAAGTTISNTGTISGSNGGAGAAVSNTDPTNGNGGDGGDGVQGAGITIINSGKITAGKGGAAGSGQAGKDGIAAHLLTSANGNTLEIHNGSNIDGYAVAEGSGNVFILGGDDDATFSETVSSSIDNVSDYQGFQTVRKSGTSTWTLAATYNNAWQIRGGILQIGDNGILGSASTIDTGESAQKGFLAYAQSSGKVTTLDSLITGSGGVRQSGQGTLVLTNTGNTYSGGTELNAGIISVASDNALGDPNSALTFNNGTLQVTGTSMTSMARPVIWGSAGGGFDIADAANTFDVTQDLSDGGALRKSGAGTLVLTGTNTYIDGTTINEGTLQIGNGAANGTLGQGPIVNNAVLALERGDNNLVIDDQISGVGAVIQRGTGTTVLTADNIYTGGTSILSGALQLGNGGTTGSVEGGIVNDANLTINRGDAAAAPYDFNNKTTGSGSVTIAGSGVVKFSNEENNYSGGTILNSGILQIGSDAVLGNASGGLTFNNGTLAIETPMTTGRAINILKGGTFKTDEDLTITGMVAGDSDSAFDKTGNGRLILADGSDASGFNGLVRVNNGVMLVDNQFGGRINVNSGGHWAVKVRLVTQ